MVDALAAYLGPKVIQNGPKRSKEGIREVLNRIRPKLSKEGMRRTKKTKEGIREEVK